MSLLRKSLILIGLVVGGLIVGQLILSGLIFAGGADFTQANDINTLIGSMENTMPFKIGIGLNNIVMFGLSAYLFKLIVSKNKFSKYFNLSRKLDGNWLGLCVLLMISIYPLIVYSAQWIQSIDLPSWAQSMDQSNMNTLASVLEMNGPWDLTLNLLIVAVTPAICEELFFRGVMQKEINRHLSNPHMAIILTSIVFSAIHMSIEGFTARLMLGLVLGYTYHYTMSLWYPILLHLFNNGLQVLALYFSGANIKEMDPTEGPEIHWVFAIVSLAVAIVIFMHIKTKSEKDGIIA